MHASPRRPDAPNHSLLLARRFGGTHRRRSLIQTCFWLLAICTAFWAWDSTRAAAPPASQPSTQPVAQTSPPAEGDPQSIAGGAADAAEGEAAADDHSGGHSDPIAPVLMSIVIIVLGARVSGHFFEICGQPAVLGELVVGVILGNLALVGVDWFEFLKVDFSHHAFVDLRDYRALAGVTMEHLSRIGVILLLFEVGLETSMADMRKVGLSAMLVAVVGVICPMALGWGCGALLLPDHHWTVHMFIGATLCATSVGITARVLRDLGRSKTKESQIILGAAVIDDVLGLVVLAVAQGIIGAMNQEAAGGSAGFGVGQLALIMGKALGFLVVALVLGQFISRPLFKVASYLRGRGLLIITALVICFSFSWAADAAGLATIVGAFAAGLILEEVHYRDLRSKAGEHDLETLIHPLASLLVPIFFVEMGLHVDLRSFADPSVLWLGTALIVAAVIGKQACSLAVVERGLDRISVGIGMIPRGEVGLIFAGIGLQLKIGQERIIDNNTYSALVVMVIVTTLVTPPLLKISLARGDRRRQAAAPPA